MSLIRATGIVKSSECDAYGNVHIKMDIQECYKESYRGSVENEGGVEPYCDEFLFANERPLSCVNAVDIAKYCGKGDVVSIEAYEGRYPDGRPADHYHAVSITRYSMAIQC